MNNLLKYRLILVFGIALTIPGLAQTSQTAEEKEAAYTRVIMERADKIVSKLEITNPAMSQSVKNVIAEQYRNLNQVHEKQKADLKALKENKEVSKDVTDAEVKKLEAALTTKLDQLHRDYLSKLSKDLSAKQIELVKDGMTYGVLPITYKAYQEMMPNLTEAQKVQILAYLTEAREHAMDAESSEKKHGWFGKYKGKINNYLSAAGIDMKKAEQEWAQRRKAAEGAK